MRIGELSRRTGVPTATIKYYVREGLLPPGHLTRRNQASYDTGHEHRLRLIRALLGVGNLSISTVTEVLSAVDDPSRPVHKVLGAATDRLPTRTAGGAAQKEAPDGTDWSDEVTALIDRRGWKVSPESPAAGSLADALAALDRLGHGAYTDEVLDTYADAAEEVARADLAYVARHTEVPDLVETAVIGTVLGEAVMSALRRLAHVDASARRYGEQ